jgi:hypothetical protein
MSFEMITEFERLDWVGWSSVVYLDGTFVEGVGVIRWSGCPTTACLLIAFEHWGVRWKKSLTLFDGLGNCVWEIQLQGRNCIIDGVGAIIVSGIPSQIGWFLLLLHRDGTSWGAHYD